MKVYVIWYDNGKSWEDNFQCIHRIYATYEAAEKYLDENYHRHNCKLWDGNLKKQVDSFFWKPKEVVCSKGIEHCYDCDKYKDWANSDCEDEDFCDEYSDVDYYRYYESYESYEIREWDLLE